MLSLSPGDFQDPFCGLVFRAVCNLNKQDVPIDKFSIATYLQQAQFKGIDEAFLLFDSCDVPNYGQLDFLSKIIKKASKDRKTFELFTSALDFSSSLVDINKAREAIEFGLKNSEVPDYSISDADIKDSLDSIIDSGKREITGIPTGFRSLDTAIKGLQLGNLTTVAARTSVGKTTFALNIVANVIQSAVNVYISSLEMNKKEILERLIRILGDGYSTTNVEQGADKLKKFSSYLTINDVSCRPDQIFSEFCAANARKKHQIFILDHIGLARSEKADNRVYELDAMTMGLKNIARSENVNVLILCQVNRMVEHRKDKKITLADIRESGSIEQNSNEVILISGEAGSGPRKVNLAKNRNGPLCEFDMSYIPTFYKFVEQRSMHQLY